MTIVWFIVWLIANNVGGHEPLLFNPVTAWTATLILAIGLDLGAAHARASPEEPLGATPAPTAPRPGSLLQKGLLAAISIDPIGLSDAAPLERQQPR